jgi:hypothetical protein
MTPVRFSMDVSKVPVRTRDGPTRGTAYEAPRTNWGSHLNDRLQHGLHDMENSGEIQDVAIDGMERLVHDTRRGTYTLLRHLFELH